jgi:hypothetical protein
MTLHCNQTAIVISSIAFAGAALVLAQAGTEADVYAPLFEVRHHGIRPSITVVRDVAVPMPTLTGSSADWLKQFDDVPVALPRRRVSRLRRRRECSISRSSQQVPSWFLKGRFGRHLLGALTMVGLRSDEYTVQTGGSQSRMCSSP